MAIACLLAGCATPRAYWRPAAEEVCGLSVDAAVTEVVAPTDAERLISGRFAPTGTPLRWYAAPGGDRVACYFSAEDECSSYAHVFRAASEGLVIDEARSGSLIVCTADTRIDRD